MQFYWRDLYEHLIVSCYEGNLPDLYKLI